MLQLSLPGQGLLSPLFPLLVKMPNRTGHPGMCWFAKAVWSLHLADREKSWEKHCFPERGRKVGRWEPSQGVEKRPSLPSLGFLPPSGSECLSFKLYLTEFLSENTSGRIF